MADRRSIKGSYGGRTISLGHHVVPCIMQEFPELHYGYGNNALEFENKITKSWRLMGVAQAGLSSVGGRQS